MATSIYNQSIPALSRGLKNLAGFLDKAVQFADQKGISHDDLLTFRLIEDMKPLTYQVLCCSNTAKFLASRVGGTEDVFFEDDETTFEQLHARINRTLEILAAVDPEQMNSKTESVIELQTPSAKFKFDSGQDYVSKLALPNFHFHLCTAYCILRHKGVPVTAIDYLGADAFVKV